MFYRATCDANGCASVAPSDDDGGASHYPLEGLREWLAEGRGEFDETWTVTADDKTYCPRHAPGNIDCTTCGGKGHIFHPEQIEFRDRWEECARCGGRGYLVPSGGVT